MGEVLGRGAGKRCWEEVLGRGAGKRCLEEVLGRGAGKRCWEKVLGRGAGFLPEPKYALNGEFSLVFKNVYTFYNRCTESHYLPVPYPYQNCDHITISTTTMLFHTIFLYTGLWQGRSAGKRCRAIA